MNKPEAYWDGGDYVSLSNEGDAKIPLFTAPQWQPISTAPRDGTNILLLLHPEIAANSGYAIEIGHYEKRPLFGETWTAQNDGFSTEVDGATHWMPLPEKADEFDLQNDGADTARSRGC